MIMMFAVGNALDIIGIIDISYIVCIPVFLIAVIIKGIIIKYYITHYSAYYVITNITSRSFVIILLLLVV